MPCLHWGTKYIYILSFYIIRAKVIRYIPLETAVIFFSSEPSSKTGYWLGVCHGCFQANLGKKKQDGRYGFWLVEAFSRSPLKPLNRIQRNFTGSKISMSSTRFVFFGPIGKTRWPSRSLIGRHSFDVYVETAENSTKLHRKQDLKVFRCTLCGPLGLLFFQGIEVGENIDIYRRNIWKKKKKKKKKTTHWLSN